MDFREQRIELLEFSNGTHMDWNSIYQASLIIEGTDGNDTLTGTLDDNRLLGLAGDDKNFQAESSVMLNSQVEKLVSAMSSFDVPGGVGDVVSQRAQGAIAPVITEILTQQF